MGKISCFYCNRKCKGDVLKVGEKYFHKECFTCKVCHKKMETTGFFYKDDSFYCLDDYTRYCAAICYSCNGKIIGEAVTALEHTFHKECCKCSICQKCFSPGDKVSMRMTDFICNRCCGLPVLGKETDPTKLDNKPVTMNDRSLGNDENCLDFSDGPAKDSQSSTVPIRRKHTSNQQFSSRDRSLSNNLVPPKNSPSNWTQSGDTDLDNSARSSLVMPPKHFHLPAGNNRAWLYSSSVVGSKSHPLALSANNINRSISNTPQRINNGDIGNHESMKKLSSYPSGEIGSETFQSSLDTNDWPASPANAVILAERNRRNAASVTTNASSKEAETEIRKHHSLSQYTDRDKTSGHNSTSNRLRLSEVINRSTTDFSSLPQMDDQKSNFTYVPVDPISASRTPSAICEPLVPPRYDDHTETSNSRNDEYFRGSNRHLAHSMEFISSTNRTYVSENTIPACGRSLRNYNGEYKVNNNNNSNIINDNGLKKIRAHSNIIDYKIKADQSRSITKTIPYDQLRVSTLKMVRNISKSNLEAYLTDEEFFKLFQITKPAFYQLPEWKRNDLKKRVDLF